MQAHFLYEIPEIVEDDWNDITVPAMYYLDQMDNLRYASDRFAKSVIINFLAVAVDWHGKIAESVKSELRTMIR